MSATAAALGGSAASPGVRNPLMAASAARAAKGFGGSASMASAFAGKLKHSVKKIEQAAIVVSRARALEHVDRTHPRVPGTIQRVKVMEPMYKRNKETGCLTKEEREVTYLARDKYGLCSVKTGRFCPDNCLCNSCCNCCCEGAASELTPFGSTITSYFKLLKFFIGTFAFLAILNTPSIMANVMGGAHLDPDTGGESAFPELFATTMGNLGDGKNASTITLAPALCPYTTYPDCKMPKAHVGIMEAGLDCVGLVVFGALWLCLRSSIAAETQKVDDETIEVTDFAVFLPSIPSWFNKKRIHQHFDRILNGPDRDPELPPFRISTINVIDDGFSRLNLFKAKAKIDERLERLTSRIEMLRLDKIALGDRGMFASCCGYDVQLRSLIQQKDKLAALDKEARRRIERFAMASSNYKMKQLELREIKEKWDAQGQKEAGCCGSMARDIARREQELEAMRAKAEAQGRHPETEDPDNAVAAFVVFNNDEDQRLALELYPQDCCHSGCCQSRRVRAMSPDEERALAKSLGGAAASVGSPAGKAAVSSTSDDGSESVDDEADATESSGRTEWRLPATAHRTKDGKDITGSVPIQVRVAPDPSTVLWENLNVDGTQQQVRRTITTLLTLSLLAGSCLALYLASIAKTRLAADNALLDCEELDAIINATSSSNGTLALYTDYGEFDPSAQPVWPDVDRFLEDVDPSNPLLNPNARNNTMRNCFCQAEPWGDMDLDELVSHPEAPVCGMQACPAIALLSLEEVSKLDFCLSWLEDFSIQFGLTVVAAGSVVVVNQLLTFVVKTLSAFDAYYSEDELQMSLAWKAFLAQLFNTAFLVVLVNAYIPGLSRPEDKTRLYTDFTSSWYASVGAGLILTMCIQLVTPHISVLLAGYLIAKKRKRTVAPSQMDLNSAFMGPVFQIPLRYSQVFTFVFVVLVYSSGMPILLWIGALACCIFYWVDLYGFTSVFRTPPRTAGLIGQVMVGLMPIAMLLHIGVAVWAFGNKDIFVDEQSLQAAVAAQREAALAAIGGGNGTSSIFGDESVAEGISRATTSYVVPLLACFVLIIVGLVLAVVWSVFKASLTQLFMIITCGYGCPAGCCRGEEHDISNSFEESLELVGKLEELNTAVTDAEKRYEAAVEDDEDLDAVDRLQESLAKLQAAFNSVRKDALTTEKDFNMFRDKKIIDMFHLSPGFADDHDQLCDLRFWSPEAAAKLKQKERRETLSRSGLGSAVDLAALRKATDDVKKSLRSRDTSESVGAGSDSGDDDGEHSVPDEAGDQEAV